MVTKCSIGKLQCKNPFIIGSCGCTSTSTGIRRQIERGFGTVIAKTCTEAPREGSPAPRTFWYDGDYNLLHNDDVFRNPGVDKMCDIIDLNRRFAKQMDCRLVGSVTGNSIEEIVSVANKLIDSGVDAIEIDMCTAPSGDYMGQEYMYLGSFWGETGERISQVIKILKETITLPVWIKVDAKNIFNCCLSIIESNNPPDAYYLNNIFHPCLKIDINTQKPILAGREVLRAKKQLPVMPVAEISFHHQSIFNAAYLSQNTSSSIIVSGGFADGEAVVEAILAGASAVEVSYGIYKNGELLSELVNYLENYLAKKNSGSVEEIRGLALSNIPNLCYL